VEVYFAPNCVLGNWTIPINYVSLTFTQRNLLSVMLEDHVFDSKVDAMKIKNIC
jgi:hypothetical protein